MALLLGDLGAHVAGMSLPPSTTPNLHSLAEIDSLISASHMMDVREITSVQSVIDGFRPDVVVHLAAQALVRKSFVDPLETFTTNIVGSANILDACRLSDSVKAVAVITTDKVYRDQEWVYPYRETDLLGGHDPYSSSKAAVELIVGSYRDAFFSERGVGIATARAGNVIGGGDWSEDRIVPDAVRAWSRQEPLVVRNPQAVRPWQHVLEPLNGYLVLAEEIYGNGGSRAAYNFGPAPDASYQVGGLVRQAAALWPDAQVAASSEVGAPKETDVLRLDASKAKHDLDVFPVISAEDAVGLTVAWYQRFFAGEAPLALCQADLAFFRERAEEAP